MIAKFWEFAPEELICHHPDDEIDKVIPPEYYPDFEELIRRLHGKKITKITLKSRNAQKVHSVWAPDGDLAWLEVEHED